MIDIKSFFVYNLSYILLILKECIVLKKTMRRLISGLSTSLVLALSINIISINAISSVQSNGRDIENIGKIEESSPINVKSEIKPLKEVLLHRPGNELLNLTPNTLERLLFDDIPYLPLAQKEHDKFAQILRDNGVKVLYLEDLAAESIEDEEVREQFIWQFIDESGITSLSQRQAVYDLLNSYDNNKDLILKTMEGIRYSEIAEDLDGEVNLDMLAGNDYPFVADPMPNLYFTRDPFACIGNGVSLNKMYSVTRNRETIYGEYIFNYHPKYRDNVTRYYNRYNKYHIEGGDILNLTDKVLAVGMSQRTEPQALEQLAKNIFGEDNSIETIVAFNIPVNRAMMHLDTVFTQVDYDKFTIHPEIRKTLQTFELTKGEDPDTINIREVTDKLENTLAGYLGVKEVKLIPCGNGDDVAGAREQWNDGSNTLCIAPGVVVVYDRNTVTNEALRSNGIKVIELEGSELSRGRGGPRCMSMPFVREE